MAAPLVVQKKITPVGSADDANNVSLAFDSPVTAGNLIVVFHGNRNTHPLNLSVGDGGNTYSDLTSVYLDPHGIRIAVAVAAATGPLTVTLNKQGSPSAAEMEIYEISGYDAAVVDGSAVSATGTTAAATLALSTRATANDLLIQGIETDSTTFTTVGTIQAGWTPDLAVNNTTSNQQLKTGTQSTSTTGAITAGWTISPSGQKWAVGAIAIKGVAPIGAALAGGATDTSAATGALSTAINLGGAASDPTSAVAALTNWATVTLAAPLNTGVGSICDPHAWPSTQPTVGTVILYDPTFISIATNGNISSTTNPCTAVAQFFDGTSWQMTLVVFTPQIVGNASVTSVASGALTTAIQMTAAAASLVAATGALTTASKLAGTAANVSNATGALITAIQFAGAAISAATASGALLSGAALAGVALDPTAAGGVLVSGSAALGGGASNSVVAAAALSTAIRLVSAAASVVSAAGALATQIQLTAAALDSSSGAGSLASTAASLAGAATDTSIASASLLTQVRIAGAATELTSATGALSAQIQFLAAATDTTSASGALVTHNSIAGSAASVTAANASLTTLIQMSGLAWSSAAAQGALSTNILLSASAIATAIAAAGLNTIPLVTPPNPMADIRIISALPDRGLPSQPGDTPFGEFYQAVGERLWYGINWTQWLANRWQPDRQVVVGQSIRPTGANGYQNTCIGGGRTGLTEPPWLPYLGANVRDGSALWASGPVDDTSLGATVIATAWAADRAIQLSSGGSVDQISLVLVDTTNTTVGVDYDVLSTATTSDGQANVGTIRVLVR